MVDKKTYTVLNIRKRPWYVWVLRAIWFLWLVLWAEVTIGSWKELEHRAFVVSLVIFLVSLFMGFLLWFWGYMRFKK